MTGLLFPCLLLGETVHTSMQPLFSEGLLQGVLFQDPIQQGKLAVRALFDHLTIGKKSPPEILINPQLVLGSNFSYYLNRASTAQKPD